jgi:hypothetical protein
MQGGMPMNMFSTDGAWIKHLKKTPGAIKWWMQ